MAQKIIIRDQLERRNFADIIPYENNNKIHKDKDINAIKESIIKYGYTDPIEIDENNVILAGHGRLLAMKDLGQTKAVFKIIAGLTENEKKSYRIEHNFSSELSEYNYEALKVEIEELQSPYLEELAKPFLIEIKPIEDTAKEVTFFANKEVDPNTLFDGKDTIQCPKCNFQFLPPESDDE